MATETSPLLVVCLCAQWCHVCADYQSWFLQSLARLQAQQPALQFAWLDVEDQAELLDPLDIQDFPTLLLAVGDQPRFFGPVTPQPSSLERLIRATLFDAHAPPAKVPEAAALLGRIREYLKLTSGAPGAPYALA